MNMDVIPAIFKYVFKTLDIDPKNYWVSVLHFRNALYRLYHQCILYISLRLKDMGNVLIYYLCVRPSGFFLTKLSLKTLLEA